MERKVKYDYTFKLECVELVSKKHYSKEYISKLKGPNESNIRKWVSFYQKVGKVVYCLEKIKVIQLIFKLKVVKAIENESLSLRESSLRFNIPDVAIIVKWKRNFANFGLEGLKSKSKGTKNYE